MSPDFVRRTQNYYWSKKKMPHLYVQEQSSALRTKTVCTHLLLYFWNAFSIATLYKSWIESHQLYQGDGIPVTKFHPNGKPPKVSKNDQNITTVFLEFSRTDSCIDYHTSTRYQFSFGHCCLKQEKACSSDHRSLLWMCPGRKALASTVTLKSVCIHYENSG